MSAEEPEEKGEKDTPELSDEGKEEVKRMQSAYDESRETAILPGTDNTITGVAVNEWLDDDGNPKFGKDEQNKKNDEQTKQQETDAQQEDAG